MRNNHSLKQRVFLLVLIATMLLCCSCMATSSPSQPEPVQTEEPQTEEPQTEEPQTEPAQTEEPQLEELQLEDANMPAVERTMKRVGEENYGFWDIPDNWVNFVELDAAEGDTMLQYSDMAGANIITVRYFPEPAATVEQFLSASVQYMESIGGEDIAGATVTLNGIDALQVYGFFPDGTIMVHWAFISDDNVLHSIIAEGPILPQEPLETVFDTTEYLESSYSLEK